MSGNNLLLDTNIILYLLEGDSTIDALVNEKDIYISFISEIDLLSFKKLSKQEEDRINLLLSEVIIVDFNPAIKKETILNRKEYNLKIPDSIIAATSKHLTIPLLTSDKDFDKAKSITHLYYQK